MAGTIEINGTGGIIEGNLGAANVNVNLDPIYGNFNATTSSGLSNDNDFDTIWASNGGAFTAWIYPKSDGEGDFARIADKSIWRIDTRNESNGFVELNFYHNFSTTHGQWRTTNAVIPINHWSHIAVVYDSDSTSNDAIIYVNGVAVALTKDSTPVGTASDDSSSTLFIGNNASNGSRTFDGYMMDVKIYKNIAVSASNAGVLASKINVDPDVIGLSGLQGWFKFNADTTTDSSGNSNNLTASNMGSVVYDEFHVDVYDNSTTTDGTFTVTQGKVECKALTSLAFDGTNDNVDCGSPSSLDDTFNGTASWGFWIRPDSDGENNFGRVVEKTQWEIYLDDEDNGKTRITLNVNRGTAAGRWISGHIVEIDKWNHILWVYDGSSTSNDPVLYLNGVAQTLTESSTPNGSIASDASANLRIGNRTGLDRTFDGDIKDVRYYDYLLSAEQAASLYSNTYPQTPNHHWKFDDSIQGVATTTAADSGTETAANGSLDSYTTTTGNAGGGGGSGWQNGTLDLDGTLTIAANGTLSAPRGDLIISAGGHSFTDNGTFTHNNGKVQFDATGDNAYIGNSSSQETVFYDLFPAVQAGYHLAIYKTITVARELHIDTDRLFKINCGSRAVTLKLGTSSSAGEIHQDGGGFQFASNTSNAAKIMAVDTTGLNPWINVSGYNIDWDSGGSGSDVELENGNYSGTTATGGGGVTIKLTGDMEFDAFTVSSGDTLDLNGQRMECSGAFTADTGTTVDFGAGMLITSLLDIQNGTYDNENGASIIVTGSTSGDNIRFNDSTFTGDSTTNILINNGTTSCDWNNSGAYAGNLIVGTGTYRSINGTNNKCGNLTVATGGTLDGSDDTLTLSGDFTTSGGLIGKSAVNFDDTDSNTTGFINCGSDSAMDNQFDGGATLEAWIKPTSKGQHNSNGGMIASKVFWYFATRTDSGSNSCKLTFKQFFDGDDSEWTSTDFVIDYNKYSHVAVTYDSSNVANDVTMYVNGKQVAVTRTQAATGTRNSDANKNFTIGNYDEDDNVHFDGTIAMVRFFDDIRTVSEIRADMFNEHANMVDTGNLLAMWQFDEGTGTTIDNKGSVGAAADGTLTAGSVSGGWAGAGTFTEGTSTVNMTGASGKIHLGSAGFEFHNLGVAPSGGTTTLTKVGGHATLRVFGLLTHNGGTFAQSGNMNISILGSGTVSAGATLPYIVYWGSSTNVPTSNYQYFIANTNTVTFAGNCTFTGYWRTGVNKIVGGAFTHTVYQLVMDSGGTMDLRNSTINLSFTGNATNFNDPNSTLITGNTKICGDYGGTGRSNWKSPAAAGHEIVGEVKDLNFISGNDITIVGPVINCVGEGFRQFHHTLDTQQLLDADEAGDDDLRLTKPALDNALELMTK